MQMNSLTLAAAAAAILVSAGALAQTVSTAQMPGVRNYARLETTVAVRRRH